MAPVLGYWNIRGLATPIRLLLEQAGVEYEEKLYSCGPPPDFDKSSWLNEKFELGLDFPNLPYYIEGDLKLSQSHVIMRYLAQKHKLDGDSAEQRATADMLCATIMDYHLDFCRSICYTPDHEQNRESYLERAGPRFKDLASFMGDKKFVLGDKVSYADFVLYEFLAAQVYYKADMLKEQPSLAEFVKRVESLEAVQKYFNSSRAIKEPFMGGPAFVAGPYSDMLAKKD